MKIIIFTLLYKYVSQQKKKKETLGKKIQNHRGKMGICFGGNNTHNFPLISWYNIIIILFFLTTYNIII